MRRVYFEQTSQGNKYYLIQAFQPDSSTEEVEWGVPSLLRLDDGVWQNYQVRSLVNSHTMVFTTHHTDSELIRKAIDWFDNATISERAANNDTN